MLLPGPTPLKTLRRNEVTRRHVRYSTEAQMNTYVVWGGIGEVFSTSSPFFYFVSKSYMSNYIVPTGIKPPWRTFVNNWESGGGK